MCQRPVRGHIQPQAHHMKRVLQHSTASILVNRICDLHERDLSLSKSIDLFENRKLLCILFYAN